MTKEFRDLREKLLGCVAGLRDVEVRFSDDGLELMFDPSRNVEHREQAIADIGEVTKHSVDYKLKYVAFPGEAIETLLEPLYARDIDRCEALCDFRNKAVGLNLRGSHDADDIEFCGKGLKYADVEYAMLFFAKAFLEKARKMRSDE
ncbi:MAG: hypothetical protein MUF61_01610 [archaeon]|jgi:hypothetical protein|nr:hypothetical protein [archaeon]